MSGIAVTRPYRTWWFSHRTMRSVNLFGLLLALALLIRARSLLESVAGVVLLAVNCWLTPRWWPAESGPDGGLEVVFEVTP